MTTVNFIILFRSIKIRFFKCFGLLFLIFHGLHTFSDFEILTPFHLKTDMQRIMIFYEMLFNFRCVFYHVMGLCLGSAISTKFIIWLSAFCYQRHCAICTGTSTGETALHLTNFNGFLWMCLFLVVYQFVLNNFIFNVILNTQLGLEGCNQSNSNSF
jgi:hypothetical protein